MKSRDEIREQIIQICENKSPGYSYWVDTVTGRRRETVLTREDIEALASLIDSHVREARLDERNQVALDNYRGHTFSDSTNWKGKYEKFIENNERRIAELSPKPLEREQETEGNHE